MLCGITHATRGRPDCEPRGVLPTSQDWYVSRPALSSSTPASLLLCVQRLRERRAPSLHRNPYQKVQNQHNTPSTTPPSPGTPAPPPPPAPFPPPTIAVRDSCT